MKLNRIITSIDYTLISGSTDISISDIIYDSRKVIPGSLFVCLEGSSFDGHIYAQDAVNQGAVALLVSKDVSVDNEDITIIKVKDTRESLAYISKNFFSNPAKELTTIAITGTKGKTTTVAMIKSILECAGIKCGTIGTLGIIIGDRLIKTNNTTPESYEIQKAMREMVNAGCTVMIIEASSIGLKAHRTDGIQFDCGIFSNFSHDHIGGVEHKDMDEYLECKSMLFKQCNVGIINKDDAVFDKIIEKATCEIITYGFDGSCDYRASNDHLLSTPGFLGVQFDLSGKKNMNVKVAIPGHFSVYNALSAIGTCQTLNISDDAILQGLEKVQVKGRVEIVPVDGNYTLLIDYAHNALSMENVLSTLRKYNPNRLIVLFGAGGNRPKVRRYEMGETAGKLADLSVLTEDNSRFEDVMDIIRDIETGISKTDGKYVIVPNRKDAIRYCIENAQDGDIIVLAGKGHEDYQEIKGVKYHMDERELVAEILRELKNPICRCNMQKSLTVNGVRYDIIKLLGKGKGGYSYLANKDGTNFVLKQIHHEPCDYYTFGDKIQAEKNDYFRLLEAEIRIPEMYDIDIKNERILKEYIDGPTIFELVKNDIMVDDYLVQAEKMAETAKENGLNIDYFPTNFVVQNGLLYYIDYECNNYMEEWNFQNWGIKYWSKSPEFLEYIKNLDKTL